MPRRERVQSLRHRADQAGMLVAAANVPLTFQRTLMPRPTMDQAIVTGLSIASNHMMVSLIQESVQSVALVALRKTNWRVGQHRVGTNGDCARRGRDRRGHRLAAMVPATPRERLPRAAMRTSGYWLTMSGTAGAIIGGLQEAVGTFDRDTPNTVPVVVPAASVLTTVLELRRRRMARLDADLPSDGAAVEPLKSLTIGVAFAVAASSMSLGERLLADRIARLAARPARQSRGRAARSVTRWRSSRSGAP